jgi:hypothetical protein
VETISESEFPALFRAADHSAIVGQRKLLATTALRLTSLVTAAIFGAVSLNLGGQNVASIITAGALASALVIEVYMLTARPDRQWYEARAAAESAKTLTWRYMVGGEPFGHDVHDERSADVMLLHRFGLITRALHSFVPVPLADGDVQVTEAMRKVRKLPFDERKRHYLEGRIDDQRMWYRGRARTNDRRASRWSVGLASLEALGLVAAVLGSSQLVKVDLPGIIGAMAAAGIAWIQTRQHRQIANAYSVAALELGDLVSRAEWPATEPEWAHFVDEAEEAIAREHVLWAASHS